MDSHQKIGSISLLSLLFFFALAAALSLSASQSEKVSLELYYETLCPYCANFIVNSLVKLVQDDELMSVVDLKLIPYGNAKIGPNNTITCQHGTAECFLNTVEACGIHAWPQLSEHFPFIYCVESLVHEHKYPQWESCFEKLSLDSNLITHCISSGHGKELELKYAAETAALQPPHRYVPWVVVNGQPLYEDYENFVSYICKAYKGTSVPKACNELKPTVTHGRAANFVHPACYGEEAMTPTFSTWMRSTITRWMTKKDSF